MNLVLVIFAIFLLVQALSGQTTKVSVKGDPCTTDDDCNNDLLCNERTLKCDDDESILAMNCSTDAECLADEFCETIVSACVPKVISGFVKRCKTDADCDKGTTCLYMYGTGLICNIKIESCKGKCTGPNQVCYNSMGKATCACRYPYSGTPPDCNLNCSADRDCRSGKDRCREGKCVDACIGECTTDGLICSASNHRGLCFGRG